MPKDDLCPLGFAPHSIRPTRCKRCFRDYNEHKKKDDKPQSKSEESSTKTSSESKKGQPITSKATTASRKESDKGSKTSKSTDETKSKTVTSSASSSTPTSSHREQSNTTSLSKESNETTKTNSKESDASTTSTSQNAVRRRRPKQEDDEDTSTATDTVRRRQRPRPGSWSFTDNKQLELQNEQQAGPSTRRSSASFRDSKESNKCTEQESKVARRQQIESHRELRPSVVDEGDIPETTSADVKFILQVKTSTHNRRESDEDAVSVAATETTETTLTYHDSIEDLQATVQSLKKELEESERRCSKLECDKRELQACKTSEKDKETLEKTAAELLKLRAKIHELETTNEDARDEANILKLELKEAQDDLEKRPTVEEYDKKIIELQQKLHAAESMCEELMEETEEYKKEINELEDEMDEMQDNFREDQADEYRDLRKELEQTAKNSRILQFKLRKAERQCEHLESEKNELSDRLKTITNADNIDIDRIEQIRRLEAEVKAAKDVAVNMNSEMELLKNKLQMAEEEKDALREDKIPSSGKKGLSPKDRAIQKPVIHSSTAVATKGDKDDMAQLLREMYDSLEREKDLKEQLKFSEEEATSLRKKLASVEEENESLILQVKKMASLRPNKGRRSAGGHSPGRESQKEGSSDADSGISDDSEDQLSLSDLKLQMELLEQESKVLRKKLEEMESENESLQKEVKFLEGALSEKPKAEIVMPSPGQATDVYYEQRIKILENETKDLCRKLIDKERENEQLSVELIGATKGRRSSRAVPAVQRSRSLDSDTQLDLKRQLQLVEQEAVILRQKTLDLENENDKLSTENHKLQIRADRKGPPTSNEKLAMENVELKGNITTLEKKISALMSEGGSLVIPGVLKEHNESGNTQTADENSSRTKKSGVVSRLKEQVGNLEGEVESLKKKIDDLEEENQCLKKGKSGINSDRKPLKITESTTKQEMKKYITELEGQLKYSSSLGGENYKEKKELTEKELAKIKGEMEHLQTAMETMQNRHQTEVERIKNENSWLQLRVDEEKVKATHAEEEIANLKKEKESLEKNVALKKISDGEIASLKKKVEQLEKSLEDEKLRHGEVRKRLETGELVEFSELRKVKEEKHKLQKEIVENQKKFTEAEKKIVDLEQTVKDFNKTQRNLKRELEESQRELETERVKLKKVDSRQSEVAVGWLKEREELKKLLNETEKREELAKEELRDENSKLCSEIEKFKKEVDKQQKDLSNALQEKEEELKRQKDKVNELQMKLDDMEKKMVSKNSGNDGEYFEKWKKLDATYRKEKGDWLNSREDFESQLKAEQKRRERMERNHESELRDRDEDMLALKDKYRRAENEVKRLTEQRGDAVGDLRERINDLEKQLTKEKQEYEDLTTKYELLEEDYVVIKAQGVMAKEQIESNYNALKRDHVGVESELKTLRETFNIRQDTWIKEKLDLQERVKELSGKLARSNVAAWDLERARLKDTIEEKTSLCEQLKKDEKVLKEDLEKSRKQVDEIKKKLDDFDRVKAYSKNVSGDDFAPYQKEIQELKNKLQKEEKSHRSEMAAVKMKTDQRVAILQDDIHALHLQNAKFRRERDTFKEILDGAQKNIADLKTETIGKEKSSKIFAQLELLKQKLDKERKEKDDVLDKLDISERNCSKVKTEYMTEKASWEIKTAEMQTKINELEEATILQGGKSKIFGVKTKLELAWQKEREEQHRLLTESHKMAKDLKQRLLDVEAARDKERIESKKQLDDFRKIVEGEHSETQNKIEELQNDLLELRDAHAKMRASSERFKRDKDRLERERDELRGFLTELHQLYSQDKLTISSLVEELHKMKMLVPSVLGESLNTTVEKQEAKTPSLLDDTIKQAFKTSFKRISVATDELRRAHGAREEDRVKRNLSFRRAVSEDEDEGSSTMNSTVRRRDDPLTRWQNPQRVTNYPASPPSMYISMPRRQSLYRKSLSLDQSFNVDAVHAQSSTSSIWKSQDTDGSNSSLAAAESLVEFVPTPSPRLKKHLRKMKQSSIDSDISGTSASSRDVSVERDKSSSSEVSRTTSKTSKKGGGIKEKLKKLTKSKSIEGTPTAEQIRQAGFQALAPGLSGGSSSSITSDTGGVATEVKGKDLKSRIANLFKKSSESKTSLDKASLSSTGSTRSSTLRIASSGNKSGTLPRYGSTSALHQLGKK